MFLGKYDLEFLKKTLYTGSVSDILDKKGYTQQACCSAIRPVSEGDKILGTACTVLAGRVYTKVKEPLKMQLLSIEALQKDDIYCAAVQGSDSVGFYGELMATGSRGRGAVGALIDGAIRDAEKFKEMKFPVFATGFRPTTVIGRVEVVEWGCPVEIGGVKVFPGDVIFGDIDGVVVIPKDIAIEVIDTCLTLVEHENEARAMLIKGDPITKVYDALHVM